MITTSGNKPSSNGEYPKPVENVIWSIDYQDSSFLKGYQIHI